MNESRNNYSKNSYSSNQAETDACKKMYETPMHLLRVQCCWNCMMQQCAPRREKKNMYGIKFGRLQVLWRNGLS